MPTASNRAKNASTESRNDEQRKRDSTVGRPEKATAYDTRVRGLLDHVGQVSIISVKSCPSLNLLYRFVKTQNLDDTDRKNLSRPI